MNHVRGILIVVLVLAAVSGRSLGQADSVDRARQSLDRARVTYEQAMDDIREDVIKAINLKVKAAAKSGTDAVKKAGDELDAFTATGAWPDVPPLQQLRNRAARAAEAMRKAYGNSLAEYTKLDDAVQRKAIAEESDQFESQGDMVPWSNNLVTAKPEAERTLVAGGSPLTLALELKGDYRLEVMAHRTDGEGVLSLDIPASDEGRANALAMFDDAGKTRVLIAVCDGAVHANLGAACPIKMVDATAEESRRLSLRATAGTVIVESIRVKPVIEGSPEQAPDKTKQAKKEKEKNDRPDHSAQLLANTTWSGFWWKKTGEKQPVTAKVISRDGRNVELQTPNWWGNGKIIWAIKVNGKSLDLLGMSYRGPHGTSLNVQGSGTVNGNYLRMTYRGTWSNGERSNQPLEGNIELTLE